MHPRKKLRATLKKKNNPDYDKETLRLLPVIPACLRAMVLRESHESFGHLGIHKTWSKISERYYWPRMYAECSDFVNSCETCGKTKRNYNKPNTLHCTETQVYKLYVRISTDICGPMPTSYTGHKYILAVVDHATRHTIMIPLRDIDTVTVAEQLVDLFYLFSFPRSLLSDNGNGNAKNIQQQLLPERQRTSGANIPGEQSCNLR